MPDRLADLASSTDPSCRKSTCGAKLAWLLALAVGMGFPALATAQEMGVLQCSDGIDNDGDTLTDCEDTEFCCFEFICMFNPACLEETDCTDGGGSYGGDASDCAGTFVLSRLPVTRLGSAKSNNSSEAGRRSRTMGR